MRIGAALIAAVYLLGLPLAAGAAGVHPGPRTGWNGKGYDLRRDVTAAQRRPRSATSAVPLQLPPRRVSRTAPSTPMFRARPQWVGIRFPAGYIRPPVPPSGGFATHVGVNSPAPAVPGAQVAGFNTNHEIAYPSNGETYAVDYAVLNLSRSAMARGTVVRNPMNDGRGPWSWNHGVAWAPAPYYWGGGFWGPYSAGVPVSTAYGSIVSAQTNEAVTSYKMQPDSVGATLFWNYALSQEPCGSTGLVVIYGPGSSIVCAQPNAVVAAGNYFLELPNLTLVAM